MMNSANSYSPPTHRAVAGAEHFDEVSRRAVTKGELAARGADLLRALAEKPLDPFNPGDMASD